MAKKVLVTGAAGFIGSHLVDLLADKGYDIVATDLPGALMKAGDCGFLHHRAMYLPADLSLEEEIKTLFEHKEMRGVQTVFHLGAIFDLFPPWSVMNRVNVGGTFHVLKHFAELPKTDGDKRFILFSSGVVTSPILAASNYGRSKLGQEEVLRHFWGSLEPDKWFEPVIIRPAAVIGPRSRYGAAKIVEMVAGGQMQFYVGEKNLVADLIHVDDVVAATVLLAEVPWLNLIWYGEGPVPVFDLVNDSSCTYEELLDFLAGLLKRTHDARILPVHLPVWLLKLVARWQEFLARAFHTRPKIPVAMLDFFRAKMEMDNSPIKALGFGFKYPDSKMAVEDTVQWYLGKGWI